MASKRYRDFREKYPHTSEKSIRPNEGIQDFTTGQEPINRDKIEKRREIVNETKNVIDELKNNDSIQGSVADIIKEEQNFRISQGKKGSAETYDILGKLERNLRRNKNIDWNSIIVAAERNGDLTAALYEIREEILDLRSPSQQDSAIQSEAHSDRPQNRSTIDQKIQNLPSDIIKSLTKAVDISRAMIKNDNCATKKEHNQIKLNTQEILLNSTNYDNESKGRIRSNRMKNNITFSVSSPSEALSNLNQLSEQVYNKHLNKALRDIKSLLEETIDLSIEN